MMCGGSRGRLLLMGFVVLAVALAGSPAPAQDSRIEEVVVTARKKEESLQSIPISISAFSREALDNKSILNLEDLARQTPGLEFASSGSITNNRPVIRGLSQQTRVGDEVNVSTFVDGVYSPGFSGTTLLFDALERIEVIRGPQSALYGRNSFAGAINYVTKRPADEFGAGVRGTVATEDQNNISGFVTGPVVADVLSLRLDAGHNESGGTHVNSLNGERLGSAETDFVRLGLRSAIGDNLELNASIWYQDDELQPAPQTIISRLDSRRVGIPEDAVSPFELGYALTLTGVPGKIGRRTLGEITDQNEVFSPDRLAGGDRETLRASLRIDWQLGDFLLSSLTGYQERETTFFSDLDETADGTLFSSGVFGLIQQPSDPVLSQTGSGPAEDRDEISQDLRLAWDPGESYNGAVGIYFSKEDFIDERFRWGDPAVSTSNAILPAPPPKLDERAELENEFFSVYAAFEIDLFEQFTLSLEGRYTEEEKSAMQTANNFPSDSEPVGDLGTQKFDYFTPRIIFSWLPTDDALLYVQAAKGVKSGGYNANAPFEPERTYDTEKNWTYELGAKLTLWDGRALLNGAFYYVDWENQQILTLGRDSTGTMITSDPIISNIGESEVTGAELEGVLRLLDSITLNVGYAYTDPEFKDAVFGASVGWGDCLQIPGLDCDANGESTGRVDGNRLPNTAEHTVNFGGQLDRDLGVGSWTAFMRADYLYRSKRYTDAENLGFVPSRKTVNLRIGLRDDNWTFDGFCNNILDDRTPNFGFASRDFFGVPNFTVVNRNGRICGVTVGYRLGG